MARRRKDPQVVGVKDLPQLDLTADIDLSTVVLDGKDFDIRADEAITAAGMDRTIEGASTITLTVHDPDRELQNTPLFKQGADLDIPVALADGGEDELHFSLARIEKNQDRFDLIFEEREIHWLRLYKKPLKVARGAVTRAEFIYRLVREVKQGDIPFFCPELHKTQRIERDGTASKNTKPDPRASQKSGWTRVGATIDVGSDAKQTANGGMSFAELLVAGDNAGLRGQDLAATLGLENNPVSAGVNVGMKMGTEILIRKVGGGPTYRIVKSDNGSGQLGDPHYKIDLHGAIARRVLGGGKGDVEVAVSGTVSDSEKALIKARDGKYEFSRGQGSTKESSWTAIQRLARDVNWRAFVVFGVLYFIKDDKLFLADPLMVLSEATPGVNWIDYRLDTGHDANEATIECRAGVWVAPPGTIVKLEDSGPADGKWLVTTISRPDLFSPETTIELRQPVAATPEPGGESSSSGAQTTPGSKAKLKSDGTALAPADAPAAVAKIIAAANEIHTKPYSQSGPRTPNNKVLPHYDCSSASAHALAGAGLVPAGQNIVSSTLESFGEAGAGKWVSVYANAGHAFITVAGLEFDTSHYGPTHPGGRGPRWLEGSPHPKGGFTVRHPKGL